MSGMDCSGFVRRVYRHIFYVDLPPTAACQSRLSIFDDVPLEGLRTGDLIYFSRTPKREKINHVGSTWQMVNSPMPLKQKASPYQA
jgi:cell wall-associated NlpC family hydrolase